MSGNLNVNFTKTFSPEIKYTVRVATPDFVDGALPSGSTVYVDIDVYTPDHFQADETDTLKKWTRFAHEKEKEAFFGTPEARNYSGLKGGLV